MNEVSFYYGNPKDTGSWDQAASIFAAHDSVNSARTSSLPLVQFWKPMGKESVINPLADKMLEDCGVSASDVEQLNFEYPVPVKSDCNGKGKASMTDLMIISKYHAIAIEAKWTECKKKYEPISVWKKEGKDKENRNNVLKGWIGYIKDFADSKGFETKTLGEYDKIPYQLLHRIASACAVAKQQGKKEAIVIYQLFYDPDREVGCVGKEERVSKAKMEDFAKMLAGHYENLFKKLTKIRFYITLFETKMNQSKELAGILDRVTDKDSSSLSDIFVLMQKQKKNVYEFSNPPNPPYICVK